MATDWNDVDVLCPFYRRTEGRRISCEGLLVNSVIQQRFRDERSKGMFMRRYCNSAWEDCPIAIMIDEAKY